MTPRDFLLSIVAGAAAALLALAVLGSASGLVLIQLAQLPLFLVGFGLGVKPVLVATVSLFLVTAAASDLLVGLAVAAVFGLTAAVVVRQALLTRGDGKGGVAWYPPGGLLATSLGLAASAGALMIPAVVDLPPDEIARMLAATGEMMRQLGSEAPGTAEGTAMLAQMLRFVPGMFAVWLVVSLAVNGAIAQALLARFGRALRPSPRMDQLALPSWIGGIAAIASIGAFFPGLAGVVAGNLVILAAVGFLFAGLAGILAALAGAPVRAMALAAIYLLLLGFAPALFAVVLLGILEPWVGLRRRFAGPAPTL
jgi:hypothetical protein